MASSIITCAQCGLPSPRRNGDINRARAAGLPLYCDRKCAGLNRRETRSKAELVAAKRLYDIEYRARNLAKIKAAKHAHFKRTYDPEAARVERQHRMPAHAEYCRRPEYREYKAQYDRRHLAQKQYGEYWEAAMLERDLTSEVLTRQTRYEIDLENGKLNKTTNRRRDYDRLISNRS